MLKIIVSFLLTATVALALEWGPQQSDTIVILIPDEVMITTSTYYLIAGEGESGEDWMIKMDPADKCHLPGFSITPITGKLLDFGHNPVNVTIDPTAYHFAKYYECQIIATLVSNHSATATFDLKVLALSEYCDLNPPDFCVHGNCNNASHHCDCEANYYGASCYTYCMANETCSAHGSCATNNGTCLCDTNWLGKHCDSYCDPNVCLGHGHCSSEGCVCENYYFGSNCSVYCNATAMCSNNGVCNNAGTGCVCQESHWGPHCENSCQQDCGTFGYCNATTAGCTCKDNWFGNTCDTFCDSFLDCNGNGHCSDQGSCICNSGYMGPSCQFNKILLFSIVGGAVLVLIIVAIIICVCVRRRRNKGYQQIN